MTYMDHLLALTGARILLLGIFERGPYFMGKEITELKEILYLVYSAGYEAAN